MYVYRPEAFKAELKRHPDVDPERFKLFCNQLKSLSREQARSRFQTIYPFLKRKEGNLRLIAEIRRIKNDFILCWLKVYLRGDRDYRDFLDNHKIPVKISDEELEEWLQAYKAEQNCASVAPQPLPAHLQVWLDRPRWHTDLQNTIIYESHYWLQQFLPSSLPENWQTYHQALLNLVDSTDCLGQSLHWANVWLYETKDCAVLYSKFTPVDEPECPILFLIAPLHPEPNSSEIDAILANLIATDQPNPSDFFTSLTLDELTALASRAYPDYLLGLGEFWQALEKEASVNLALSVEEQEILDAVSTTQEASLPLFLNGQAGSGKSTMLFYLFADYCHRYLVQNSQNVCLPHPLFLAYNDRLLQVAQEQVTLILKSHHHFVANNNALIDVPDLQPFFRCFRHFLRSLLPLEERANFQEKDYVSFHRFRKLLKRQHRPYSPERCWQTIRTFIKGYILDEHDRYLEIEDYEDIPKKERTITIDEFRGIYNTVWQWYKNYTKEHQLWDDQDLVRKVLHLQCCTPTYTAIFCDEAQDFTRLELQAIMRLSVLYEYDLESQHIDSLPFAFAGDPLQTLNPTGFSWKSLKASFYNEVLATLSPTRRLKIDMNFRELECNYRSTRAIVGVSNLVQLWRKYLFDLKEIAPQKSRRVGNFQPQKFILEKDISLEETKKFLQNTIMIIPCDEGGEKEYIEKDTILASLYASNGDTSDRTWNIFSAIEAKGLEFNQVVLYKFGEACPPGSWQVSDEPAEEVNYFFNKLYVAVSRATDKLFIFDTETGDRQLWNRANQSEKLDQFLSAIKSEKLRQQWRDRVCLIQACDPTTLVQTDDLETLASQLEKQGIDNGNTGFLRRAKGAYQRLENKEKAQYCEAMALKFEGEFQEAGKHFKQQENWQEAFDCYWQGMVWQELQLIRDRVEIVSPSQAAIIDFMSAETGDWTTLEHFSHWLSNETDLQSDRSDSSQVDAALKQYLSYIQNAIAQPDSLQPQQWQFLGNTLQPLKNNGYPNAANLALKCFYWGRDYQATVSYAEAGNITTIREYYLAKAEVLGFPTGLQFLIQAQEYQQVIQHWKDNNKPRDREWLNSVATAYEALDNYKNALATYSWLDNLEKVKSCLQIIQSRLPQDFTRSLRFTIRYYIDDGYWLDAIATLESHLELLNHPENTSFKQTIISHLAKSDLTPDTLNIDLRKRYTTFLKQQILASNWQQYVSMEYVGVTLEKIGALVETLQFYEDFTATSIFAQKRWLATKLRQAQYYQTTQATAKAQKAEAQATQKAQQWQIALQDITLAPPDLTDVPVFSPSPSSFPEIRNLPPNIIPETRDRDLIGFQIDGLEIRMMKETQQVLILDILTEKSLRIEGRSRKIQSQQFTLQSPQGEALHFSDNSGKYRGVVRFTPFQLELILPDRDRPIEICWS